MKYVCDTNIYTKELRLYPPYDPPINVVEAAEFWINKYIYIYIYSIIISVVINLCNQFLLLLSSLLLY